MSEVAFIALVAVAIFAAAAGLIVAAITIPEDEDCGCEMGEMLDRIYKEDS